MSEIYIEHAAAVYRCLLGWTRSPALAEELTAETFYRAIVADQQVRAATARGYLIAIARNEWRKSCAKRNRDQPLIADAIAPGQSGESLVDFQLMLAALADLPDELREPLVLCLDAVVTCCRVAAPLCKHQNGHRNSDFADAFCGSDPFFCWCRRCAVLLHSRRSLVIGCTHRPTACSPAFGPPFRKEQAYRSGMAGGADRYAKQQA